MQQHQSEQAVRVGVRRERGEKACQTNRLAAQIAAMQCVTERRAVAFIEYEIDNVEHIVEALFERGRCGYLERNAGVSNLCLCAYYALRYRRRTDQKCVRNFFRCEPANLAECERYLRVR